VLRRHPDAIRYGRLLLDVAERALAPARRWEVPNVVGAPALLDPPRMVEARIRALVAPAPGRFAHARAAALLAAATAVVALACVAPRPQRAPIAPVADSPVAQRATIDSLRAQVAALSARLADTTAPPPPHVDAPTDAELRAGVARVAPAALTGAMGHRPFVWLVLDTAGRVAQSATGADGMLTQREIRAREPWTDGGPFPDQPDTLRVLDADGVFRTFPSLRQQQLHSFGWRMLTVGTDTVNVIWVRPTSLGWKVTLQGTALRDAAGASRTPTR
jgi:hypothetical protein